ncbi:MAG: (1-_4)-alpha-D-glucan 1-alpha-D-glucosylmutase [Frankiaceae bacterium]|nr:(1->4)-alpha-D-glucan 1-alpha-D-glucosylmutase [Frankiaceae bacterium]
MPAPVSTYRLQLTSEFTFADAAAVVPYLHELGVTHVYLSPILQAAPGSTHGYDVVDHGHVSAELGGPDGHAALHVARLAYGMGEVVDVVPNHMAVPVPETLNPAWWDVLRHGPESRFAAWFDIDWTSRLNPGKVVLAVLGDPLEDCLARGEIELVVGADGPRLRYYDHVFPVAPGTGELDSLRAVIDAQHYRLASWRISSEELNYRRFFDVDSLVGLRMEDAEVFSATHALLLAFVRGGVIDGLRIDHPDGLADPARYLALLAEQTGGCWTVVEKILGAGEDLPREWATAGTTGYDALLQVSQLYVDPTSEDAFTNLYVEMTGEPGEIAPVVEAGKRFVLADLLAAEVERLHEVLVAACRAQFPGRDLTYAGLREALLEVLIGMPVYRAYLDAGDAPAAARAVLETAREHAHTALPRRPHEVDSILQLLLEAPRTPYAAEFRRRFGQTTGPATAKGVEDTAFYRYHRFAALNEVGGEPQLFGRSLSAFHDDMVRRQREWPTAMTTLSTHDTKRSEDLRARMFVLSEMPNAWGDTVASWFSRNAKHRSDAGPDRNLEYLLYQTIVGAWPLSTERAIAYAEKASREAKQHTSWTDPEPAYDDAVRSFLEGVLSDEGFVAAVDEFVGRIRALGHVNGLSQKLVQLTMPGVPDVYQGTESWDFSLVDPDNRRPVDYAERSKLLREFTDSARVPAVDDTGAAKVLVTARTLRLRRERPDSFGPAADYVPLLVDGAECEHLIGFGRGRDVVVLAPRLVAGLERTGWQDTVVHLPAGTWRDAFTGTVAAGGAQPVDGMLREFPVALLVREEGS